MSPIVRPSREQALRERAPRLWGTVTAIAFAVTLVFGLFRFDGPARGYWDTYITAPAMFMNGDRVDFVLKDGAPAFQAQLEGVLPEDLVDRADYGIITKDQRLGPGIAAATPYAFFGRFGLRLFFALAWALVVPLGVLLGRRVLPDTFWRDAFGLIGGLVLAWNPYSLSVDRLNANVFALPLILLLLALVLPAVRLGSPALSAPDAPHPREVPPWLVGLVFGLLATIREEAVVFVPALTVAYLSRTHRPFLRRLEELVVVGVVTVLVMLPIFAFKKFAFGDPFLHPSQYAHYEGFRPEFPHRFIGAFNGLFNWPFHTELVRTPHFGYPTYLLFPLVTLRALGLGLAALAVVGMVRLATLDGWRLTVLVLFSAPVYALFGPQENWEEVKMTFMLLAMPPLGVYIAAGADALADVGSRKVAGVGVVAGMVVLFGVVKLLGAVEVPADPRWSVRFPNSDPAKNPAVQIGLAETERSDWVYFQSMETEDEIARERAKLSAGWPWPAPYLPLDLDARRERVEMREELGLRYLRVLEIWGYIYGTRR